MGSGKSAVGRDLAKKLGWQFFDTDKLIEQEAGLTIAQIFEARGEPAFRRIEASVVLASLDSTAISMDDAVISLGGGAITVPAIRKRLLREPLVILLDVDKKTAFERAHGGNRPLAKNRSDFIKLYTQRKSLYKRVAKYVVDTRGQNVDSVANSILEILKDRTGVL